MNTARMQRESAKTIRDPRQAAGSQGFQGTPAQDGGNEADGNGGMGEGKLPPEAASPVRMRPPKRGASRPVINATVAQDVKSMLNGSAANRPGQIRMSQSFGMYTLRDLLTLARNHSEAALNVVVELAHSEEAAPAVRLSAAIYILDRAFGRPHQSIAVSDTTNRPAVNWAAINPADLMQLEGILLKAAPEDP